MSLRIKCNFDIDDNYNLVSGALLVGGQFLNGATKLNDEGTYNAPAPGVSLYGDTFVLEDKWFNGESQDIDTVTKAVEQATGIKLRFNSQMLSSGPATMSSYEIVNQEKYNATIGKFMEFLADMRSGPKS